MPTYLKLSILICPFLLLNSPVIAQDSDLRKIEGIVFDTKLQNVLIGASLFVEETGEQTITGYDGKFELMVPKGKNVIIRISYTCEPKKIITAEGEYFYAINMSKKTQWKTRRKIKKMKKTSPLLTPAGNWD